MDVNINITGKTIISQRLLLRPWKKSDINDLYEITKTENILNMLGLNRHLNIEEAQELLIKYINGKNAFAIIMQDNGKVIGNIALNTSFVNSDENLKHLNAKELVYLLAKDYWGKGIMPEAVNEIINYSFNTLQLDALTCGHFAINANSKKVIEKCGFKYLYNNNYYSKTHDKNYDNLCYILYNTTKYNSIIKEN